jgi:alpha-beta hydrolase superfamily lysophospholipase
VREKVLSLLIMAIGRALLLRDRWNGRRERMKREFPFNEERMEISSGGRRLSAVYVSAGTEMPAVLICHGIGELVEYWAGVQTMLKERGVSSLVFNYSGYGKSTGRVSVGNCEEDAVAAFRALAAKGHPRIFLLGYSLGTGVSSAVAGRVTASGLILCEGFSSLREAGYKLRFLRLVIPDRWNTVDGICGMKTSVLVMHSDADELFPVSMAERVVDACGTQGVLVVVKGVSHNEPIFAPMEMYWGTIAEWVKARA